MDARIATSLGKGVAITEREAMPSSRVRELREQFLRVAALAMVAAVWVIVPVGGLAGMYYMTGSITAPLCLAGVFAAIGVLHYYLLSSMLIASDEARGERVPAVAADAAAVPVLRGRVTSEGFGQAASARNRSRRNLERAEQNTIAPAA